MLFLSLLTLGAVGCEHLNNPLFPEDRPQVLTPQEHDVVVVSRTDQIPTYPCMEQCHRDRTPDPTPRRLREFHTDIHIEHAAVMHFCDRCHDLDDLDQFRLIDGTAVSFDESARLCGQCHGVKHEDWSRGMHGIQTGSWQRVADRRTCTACHDPHAPVQGIHLTALPVPRDALEEP